MPNHFLTVGLCSRDYSNDDDSEVDFSPLANANLCELAGNALPEELVGIVATKPPCRYVHKTTGEKLRTGNSPFDERDQYNRIDLTESEVNSLTEKYGSADWYGWQSDNWGTKWGAYSTKVHEMGGDGSPVMIEFQSAWGPPNSETMEQITEYLCKTYRLASIKWIGHDPSDGSLCDVS